MKLFIALCGLLIIGVSASPFPKEQSLIKDECAHGPSYWCQNLMVAKSCNAVTHCIQTVWEKQRYPVDSDSICKICLDMVQQARDQLESNETQADLKAVFEGTCHLILIKPIRKECDKLADDFVPELVEALTSQMNPQVVCSVAGLCNNVAIDKMLADASAHNSVIDSANKKLSCKQCGTVSTLIVNKFNKMSRDDMVENMLKMCGQLSSFSDACSSIILVYFNDIYDHLKQTLNSDNICHMAGTCVAQFHQHDEDESIEIIPDSQIGFVTPDDIPCDLCKQLVSHLRDLLVANTTQAEFKTVLEGICKQTKSFKSECLSIADQYYDVIYEKLTTDLDPNGACFLIGICPKGLGQESEQSVPFMPLLPNTNSLLIKKKILGQNEPIFTTQEIQNAQLPKDVLLLDANQITTHVLKKDAQLCTLCEYFLHFVQDALASPKNEENIKRVVLESCLKLPQSIEGQCQSFVNMYGDAVIALLIQDIDPAQICPRLAVCERKAPLSNEKCPLCLFLIQEVEEILQKDRSKENIKNKLNTLCNHLSEELKAECIDFVETYTPELIDKLSSDFTPAQICLYLKLCTSKEEVIIEHLGDKKSANEILTNDIYQVFSSEEDEDSKEDESEISSPECLMCEQLIKEVEKKAVNDKSKEHIKEVLEHACSTFRKKELKQKCIEVVDKNADYIVNAIIKEVSPKEICAALGFCILKENHNSEILSENLMVKYTATPQCVLCELVMTRLENELKNKKTQEEIEDAVRNICTKLPKSVAPNCKEFVQKYGDLIISLVTTVPPKQLCGEIDLCLTNQLKDTARGEVLECAVCHATTETLAKILKKYDIEDRDLLIEKTCNLLPGKYYHNCNEFMEIYVESLKHLIEKKVNLSEICVKVGMCYSNGDNSLFVEIKANTKYDTDSSPDSSESDELESKESKKRLLGASKCTFGPSYWCSSKETMLECNAHAFCAKQIRVNLL